MDSDSEANVYCAGFPILGDVKVDEEAGTITFGGVAEGMTGPDGKPYVGQVVMPLFLWRRMYEDVPESDGLYVRISATQEGILRGISEHKDDAPLPMDNGWREPF